MQFTLIADPTRDDRIGTYWLDLTKDILEDRSRLASLTSITILLYTDTNLDCDSCHG